MNIIDGYINEGYQVLAHEEGSHVMLVPFTGMISEYLFTANNNGIEAPFYHAFTDIESLFYANKERNEFRIHNWLRDNGGIDAWPSWTENDIVFDCQINPRFDVDDQVRDLAMEEIAMWDAYDEEQAERAANFGHLDLHDEFMVHDTDYDWGERYAEDDYDGKALIGFEFLNEVQYMVFMDLSPWSGSAMAGLMPSTLHYPVVLSPLVRHNEVLGWLMDNEIDTEYIWHKFF